MNLPLLTPLVTHALPKGRGFFMELHRQQWALTKTARELGSLPRVNHRYLILLERAARIRRIGQGILRRANDAAVALVMGRAA